MGNEESRVSKNIPASDPNREPSNAPKNVLIFGETGVGKSSIINMIAGRDVAAISSGAAGCTFENTSYPIELEGTDFRIFDTTGLNEGKQGTVAPKDAIVNLYNLICDLSDGVSLLVYCVRGPRIKETTERNYALFHKVFCCGKVPIVLVVTGLENEDPMDAWWGRNNGEFAKYGMLFSDYACTTATKGKSDRFVEEYEESREKVRGLVKNNILSEPWKKERVGWFKAVVATVIRFFAKVFGWTIGAAAQSLYEGLKQFAGFSEEEARDIANQVKE